MAARPPMTPSAGPTQQRPVLQAAQSETLLLVNQQHQFDDYKRRHSKQNRDIIRENANRLIINRNLQEEIGKLHVQLLEEKAEKVALAEELRRTKEELERVRSDSSREALDAILLAVPALKQLRHKLGPRRSPNSASSSSLSSNNNSRRQNNEKRYPEINAWDGRPEVVAAGRPELDVVQEMTEKGSESDWSHNGGGGHVRQHSETAATLPDIPVVTSNPSLPHSSSSSSSLGSQHPFSQQQQSPKKKTSPVKTAVRARGRRDSALFARDSEPPAPATEAFALASPAVSPQSDYGSVIRSSTPPPSALSSSNASPLRRSPRKQQQQNHQRAGTGPTSTSNMTALVDTNPNITDNANKRRSLIERRRSVTMPRTYYEGDDIDEGEEEGSEMYSEEYKQKRRGEKRRRDGMPEESLEAIAAVGVIAAKPMEKMEVVEEDPSKSTLSKHDEVLIRMSKARAGSESNSGRSSSSGASSRHEVATVESVLEAVPEQPIQMSEIDSDGGNGRTRRARPSISYKEPSLHTKMRKPDGVTGLEAFTSRKVSDSSGPGAPPNTGRSRSPTPSAATSTPPTKGQGESAATPLGLPADRLDEEMVEQMAAAVGTGGGGRSTGLDARSSNQRRKSVLPKSRRDEMGSLSATSSTKAITSSSAGPTYNPTTGNVKGMTRTVSSATFRSSDAARSCDLPDSPDDSVVDENNLPSRLAPATNKPTTQNRRVSSGSFTKPRALNDLPTREPLKELKSRMDRPVSPAKGGAKFKSAVGGSGPRMVVGRDDARSVGVSNADRKKSGVF